MKHLAGFVETTDLDAFVKAYFDSKEQLKIKPTEKKKRPRNSNKGGGYVRPLEERKEANFEVIERPKG